MKKILFLLGMVGLIAFSCGVDMPAGPSFEEQLKKDIAEIDEYLFNNGISATSDQSGVRYLTTKVGLGAVPAPTDVVYVTVVGKILKTGQIFVDVQDSWTNVPINAPDLLASWKTVIPKMTKGSSFTIFSPSGLAYGTVGVNITGVAVPSNTNVSFEMQLFDEVAQFKIDTAAITAHVKTNNINAIKDGSGLQYVITQIGTGAKPIASSSVTFNYEGKLLATGAVFDKSTTVPLTLPLTNIIKGLQIGLPLLSAGGKATFYIPSSLGYGPSKSNAIPSNSNLIFEIELVSVR